MIVFTALFVALGVCIFAYGLASYLTHLEVVSQDREAGDAKPRYISLSVLMKKFKEMEKDLATESQFPGYICWCPSISKLTDTLFLAMEADPHEDVFAKSSYAFSYLLDDAEKKLYWRASILRVDQELRFLDPIGFLVFSFYARFICALPDRDFNTIQKAMRAAEDRYKEKYACSF